MIEVVALEKTIRELLPMARKTRATDLVADAEAIMSGKPTIIEGTRLERLRRIVTELRGLDRLEKK
jgi:hypothetical protein